jgi:uncharacterized FlgJ-related protein
MIYIDKDLRRYEGSELKKIPLVKKWKILFYISMTFNLLLILYLPYNFTTKVKIMYRTLIHHDTLKDITLHDSAVMKELINNGCVLPGVALAQFKIESSHFKSKIAIENKNIAGIKTSRSKYVMGMKNEHCAYKSYTDCIKDYILIQNRYLKNIDGKYAAAGPYVELIKTFRR